MINNNNNGDNDTDYDNDNNDTNYNDHYNDNENCMLWRICAQLVWYKYYWRIMTGYFFLLSAYPIKKVVGIVRKACGIWSGNWQLPVWVFLSYLKMQLTDITYYCLVL